MENAILTVLGAFPDMLVLHSLDHSLLSTLRGNKQVEPLRFLKMEQVWARSTPKDSGGVGNN